jgi:lipoprotein-anchoring transpeptidase ErfK/SrfK
VLKNKPKNFDTIAPVKVDVVQVANTTEVEALNLEAKDSPEEPKSYNFKLKSFNNYSFRFKPVLISVVAIFVLSSIISFGYISYENKFNDRAYYGAKVWGEDVSGKTMPEIQQLLGAKVLNYKLTIKGPDQEYVASSMDLGLIVNVDEMSTSAINYGRTGNLFKKFKERSLALLNKVNNKKLEQVFNLGSLEIIPKVEFNQVKFESYVNGVSDNIKINAQDSEVTFSGSTMQLKPAIYGREVDKNKLVSDIKDNISAFNVTEVKVEVSKVKPNIIDDAAEDVMIQAENVMKRPVVLTYQGQEFRPSQETVASWISFKKGPGSSKYELYIDESKMSGYLAFLGTKINIAPIAKKVRIENNINESVVQEGVDGLAVDKKILSSKIASQLPIKTSIKEEIPTYIDKFKTVFERVVVENDEKYIVVDISEQKMTAYLKGGQVVNTWGIVSGNPNSRWGVPGGSPTPIGKWLVMGHTASVNMTDGTYCTSGGATNGTYCLPGVKWVTWFRGGGYAIHSAYWRSGSEFGVPGYNNINGSHGCVNSTMSAAEFIFNWAPVGTPVYVQE